VLEPEDGGVFEQLLTPCRVLGVLVVEVLAVKGVEGGVQSDVVVS
jgi:hypothetical protein